LVRAERSCSSGEVEARRRGIKWNRYNLRKVMNSAFASHPSGLPGCDKHELQDDSGIHLGIVDRIPDRLQIRFEHRRRRQLVPVLYFDPALVEVGGGTLRVGGLAPDEAEAQEVITALRK